MCQGGLCQGDLVCASASSSLACHQLGVNPALGLQNDLDLTSWLDHCGYDEAWFGEHRSAGSEISAWPEIFIAFAAERTRHIRLATEVAYGILSSP